MATDFSQTSELALPQQHFEKCTASTGVRHTTAYTSSLPGAWELVLTTWYFICAGYQLTMQSESWSRYYLLCSWHQPKIWTSEEAVNNFFCHLPFCLTCRGLLQVITSIVSSPFLSPGNPQHQTLPQQVSSLFPAVTLKPATPWATRMSDGSTQQVSMFLLTSSYPILPLPSLLLFVSSVKIWTHIQKTVTLSLRNQMWRWNWNERMNTDNSLRLSRHFL